MSHKVLTPMPIGRAATGYLRDRGYEVVAGTGDDEQTLVDTVGDCEAMIIVLPTINERVLSAARNLKIIARLGVGYDCVDLDACRRHNVLLTTTPGANAESVAELTILFMLHCAWNFKTILKTWRDDQRAAKVGIKKHELAGKTLGIVGLGHIGLAVAKMAALGLGMKVIAWNRTKRDTPDYVTQIDDRDALFRQSDYVSLHVAATPETRHCVGACELDLMKPTAYLINTSRGALIDEAALIAALEAKQIAGAALDVMEVEPFNLDSPLAHMDNVLLTPHIASHTKESNTRVSLMAAKAVDDFFADRPLDCVVPELRDLLPVRS